MPLIQVSVQMLRDGPNRAQNVESTYSLKYSGLRTPISYAYINCSEGQKRN